MGSVFALIILRNKGGHLTLSHRKESVQNEERNKSKKLNLIDQFRVELRNVDENHRP